MKSAMMTKRRAIEVILNYFDTHDCELDETLCMALEGLKTIQRRLPNQKWTKENIKESIDTYIEKHGRLPSSNEMKARYYLPPYQCIEQTVGIPVGEWLLKTYPEYAEKGKRGAYYVGLRMKQMKDPESFFLSEYKRILPRTADDYNRNRTPGSPGWKSIAKRCCGCERWEELKKVTGADKIKLEGSKLVAIVNISGIDDF